MNMLVRNFAILLALAASTSVVSAQSTVTTTTTTTSTYGYGPLSPEQRTTIYREVTTQRPAPVARPGPVADYRVGAPVPEDVELSDFPEDADIDMPPLQHYQYVYVNHRVVLVDPVSSRVVDVISE